MNVGKWHATGDTTTNGAFFDVNLQSTAGGLARAGGPCERIYCSMSFEGGMPDAQGVIRTRSRLAADGDSLVAPGTWQASISDNYYDHALIPDQLYMRTAVYSNGYLAVATPWQDRSSLPVGTSAGGLQAALLATAVPSLLQDPCVEMFPEGTNTADSSVNDQQLACLAAQQASTSWARTLAQLAKQYGPGVLTTAANQVAAGGGALPGQATLGLTDDPAYLQAVGNLIRRRVANYGFLEGPSEQVMARQVLDQCLHRNIALAQCDSIAVFSPGSDAFAAAKHDAAAIAAGYPLLLTASSRAATINRGLSSGWYNLAANRPNLCDGRDGSVQQCDEYPFFSTAEASTRSSLRPVAIADNKREETFLATSTGVAGWPHRQVSSPEGSSLSYRQSRPTAHSDRPRPPVLGVLERRHHESS